MHRARLPDAGATPRIWVLLLNVYADSPVQLQFMLHMACTDFRGRGRGLSLTRERKLTLLTSIVSSP